MARFLDRLTDQNSSGILFRRLWDKVCTKIEGAFASLSDQLALIAAAATTAHWSGVSDDNGAKPEDNATLGANWSGNVTSRPAELTDGRVAAGLNSSGGIDFTSGAHVNKSLASVDSSANSKLGGIEAGATLGADLATNVTNKSLANLDSTANSKLGGIQAGATLGADLATNVANKSLANLDSTANSKLGGIEAGATLGANLATNVSNVSPPYLPPVAMANLSFKFTGSISYSAAAGSPATATISVGAGSLLLGTTTISYNAMSANVTGTGGTNVDYWLYVSSGGFSGGSHTLQATTSNTAPFNSDSNVYIGYVNVAFPAAGTSSGSGDSGGGSCIAVDSLIWMADGSEGRAGDTVAGDRWLTRHELTGELGVFTVGAVSFEEAEIFSRRGWPDATKKHRFGLWFFRAWWFYAGWFGRRSGIGMVMKASVPGARTYMARHPAPGSKWRWCHNNKPG